MSDPTPEPEVVVEVDCRGLTCPTPVIRLAQAITGVPVGAVVAVAADDVAAATDIPAWCRMRGQEYVGERVGADGVPLHLVRRLL